MKAMPFRPISSTCIKSTTERLFSDRSSQLHFRLEREDSAMHSTKKEVTISEYSELRLYRKDKLNHQKNSYTSADIKNFRTRTALDASRIRNLISSYPLKTGRAIDHAMDLGLIKSEELIGIEHLVSEKVAANVVSERRTHVLTVLRAQEFMRENYGNDRDIVTLGRVSSMSSSRSVERARIRAVWSMDDGKLNHVSCKAALTAFNTANILFAHAA